MRRMVFLGQNWHEPTFLFDKDREEYCVYIYI